MGTESCFLLMAASDPSQKMTSSNLHIYTYANLHKRNGHFLLAAGRGWYGCQRPLSPLKEVYLPFTLDRLPGSCLMVDGHWRSWPDILATSLVCFEYSRRLSRSHPLSGGISLPLISTCTSCCATEEKSASSASGEQGVR